MPLIVPPEWVTLHGAVPVNAKLISALSPSQMVAGVLVMFAVGSAWIVTVAGVLTALSQPLTSLSAAHAIA
jgi:hypothetical protein